jgi:glycosyltransferase involved in cell wall biosynthesis
MAKIAYLTTTFGALSHTYIRREIAALRSLGLDISLFSIYPEIAEELSQQDKLLAKEADCLFPLMPKIFHIFYSNIKFAITKPMFYFKTLQSVLFNKEKTIIRQLGLICIFFVSPYMALRLQKKNIVHVHVHFPFVSGAVTMCAARISGIPYSIAIHSAASEGRSSAKGLIQQIKYAKFICFPSRYNIDYYDGVFPSKNKAYLVRYGIDSEKYVPLVEFSCANKYDKKMVCLICVGRLVKKKGFSYLIEACKYLAEEGVNFRLTIIGEGPTRKELQKQTDAYNLNDRIIFKGACSEAVVKEKLEESDICIVSSIKDEYGEKEGLPVIIIEAMALGVAVIATRHSGIPEIVKHEDTGILVPEKDSMAIAKAIKLFLKDNILREKCINNARIQVVKEYNIHEVAKLKKEIFEANIPNE